jgi:DNA processing protein
MDFDALIRHSKIDAGLMMQVLMELELFGCIENREGLYFRC